MKIKMFVQACSMFGNPHTIQLSPHEYPSGAVSTYITLKTIDVEFECDELTEEQFLSMKKEQLDSIKAKIMQAAQEQCNKLGE